MLRTCVMHTRYYTVSTSTLLLLCTAAAGLPLSSCQQGNRSSNMTHDSVAVSGRGREAINPTTRTVRCSIASGIKRLWAGCPVVDAVWNNIASL